MSTSFQVADSQRGVSTPLFFLSSVLSPPPFPGAAPSVRLFQVFARFILKFSRNSSVGSSASGTTCAKNTSIWSQLAPLITNKASVGQEVSFGAKLTQNPLNSAKKSHFGGENHNKNGRMRSKAPRRPHSRR